MTNIENNIKKNKNDLAWEELFEKYNILDTINNKGYFEITSDQINDVRESRLMAKFDHAIKLPQIFQDNQLSILPISRNKYIIGHFETHHKVSYDQQKVSIKVEFTPNIQSIDYTNIPSESLALNCAFNTGIIANLLEVDSSQCYYTLSGRMSTGQFSFRINNLRSDNVYHLSVNASQCEIDAGFETEDLLLIIEAKNYLVEDFLIRQLYYPYRLWQDKINKKVIPALMTYSNANNLFSLFIYEFTDTLDYNSIKLIKQVNYQILPEQIDRGDVSDIFEKVKTKIKEENSNNIPFPQADLFPKIIDLISLLSDKELGKEEISNYYEFHIRQAGYYPDAAKYLGLIEEVKSSQTKLFRLTEEGLSILSYGYKQKILSLIEKILEHRVFYEVFKTALDAADIPSKDEIISIVTPYLKDKYSPSVIDRRSRTVESWIKWIWSQIN